MPNSFGVDSENVVIFRRDDPLGQRGSILSALLSERIREAHENLFSRNVSSFTWNKLWNLVGTSAGAGSNSLKPDTAVSEEGIELGALISLALKIETMLKQRNSEIHFPESLKEMSARVLAEMGIGKRVKPTPELFNKGYVIGTTQMISRIQIRQIITRSGHEKWRGRRWHIREASREVHRRQFFRSTLSFALPSAIVCHCMLLGASAPPQASGTT